MCLVNLVPRVSHTPAIHTRSGSRKTRDPGNVEDVWLCEEQFRIWALWGAVNEEQNIWSI